MVQVKSGVYQILDPNRDLREATPNISNSIEQKYLKTSNKIFGYISEISLVNKIDLTSHPPNIERIISNNVSKQINAL
jgi:hypothetical protein